MSAFRASVGLLAGLLLLALASAPAARANPTACASDPPPGASPRIVRGSLDGLDYNVLLPSGYETSGSRYPVLYLLHGGYYNENTWLNQTDLEAFTEPFRGDQAAIVVMPDGGPLGFYRDWASGDQQWESYHVERLISDVDSRFRTIADRSHRSIAGFSLGGLGAMAYAARHPDLFVSAAAFSGLVHLTTPEPAYEGAAPANPLRDPGSPGPATGGTPPPAYAPPTDEASGCGPSQGSAYADRTTQAVDWHNHNPTDLAVNLGGTAIYLASGNGTPCGPSDLLGPPSFAGPAFEPVVLGMSQEFDRALTQAGVAHTTDFYGCGIHTQAYAERDLHEFWPMMAEAFGAPAPRSFDFRTADPDFSVWGWTFHADPRRAPEFVEIRDVSTRRWLRGPQRVSRITRLTLTGTGTETVITPARFKPGAKVTVRGAMPRRTRADASGRVEIRVDLGPPSDRPQFAPGAGAPDFITRAVRLVRLRK